MVQEHSQLLKVISEIYTVPGNSSAWPGVLRSLSEMAGSVLTAYLVTNDKDDMPDLAANWGISDEDMRVYLEEGMAAHDIRMQYSHNLVPGQVFREFEFIPDRKAYDQNRWIQHQLQSNGIYYCLAARVSPHRLWNDFLSVNRLHSRGPHTDSEKLAVQETLPHLSRAIELHRTMTLLINRYSAALSVLDKLQIGLVILDTRGRVVVANSSAYQCCENSGTLRLTVTGELRAIDDDNDRALQHLILTTGLTVDGNGKSDGGQMTVACSDGRLLLLLEVMPIRDDGLPDRDNVRGSAVFLIDPERSEILSVDGLSAIFGLTRAEQQIAGSIVNGMSVHQVAEERNTSQETVRGQVKSVLSKTGSSKCATNKSVRIWNYI